MGNMLGKVENWTQLNLKSGHLGKATTIKVEKWTGVFLAGLSANEAF